MKMSNEEINLAMRLYLGGGEDAGYNPIGQIERLQEKYGAKSAEIERTLREYIDWMINVPVNWETESLGTAVAKIESVIGGRYPWFDEITRKKMANYFGYSWK